QVLMVAGRPQAAEGSFRRARTDGLKEASPGPPLVLVVASAERELAVLLAKRHADDEARALAASAGARTQPLHDQGPSSAVGQAQALAAAARAEPARARDLRARAAAVLERWGGRLSAPAQAFLAEMRR